MQATTFGEKIKTHRKRIGFTQAEAAEALSINDRTYWEWEKGKTEPYEVTQEGVLARFAKIPSKK